MKYFIILFFSILPGILIAQDFSIPEYKTQEDYHKYQDKVLEVISWLKEHQLNHPDRNDAHSFLKTWTDGNLEIRVEIENYVMPLIDKNPGLLMLFIGGWVEYFILNQEEYSEIDANYHGVLTLVDYYASGKQITRDLDVYNLTRMNRKKRLHKWVSEQLEP